MDYLELFTNLVALASVDGKFHRDEIQFLIARAEGWGISAQDVDSVLIGAKEGDLEITLPATYEERVILLKEMILLMAADGELAEAEKRLCAAVSGAMELSNKEFNKILDELFSEEEEIRGS